MKTNRPSKKICLSPLWIDRWVKRHQEYDFSLKFTTGWNHFVVHLIFRPLHTQLQSQIQQSSPNASWHHVVSEELAAFKWVTEKLSCCNSMYIAHIHCTVIPATYGLVSLLWLTTGHLGFMKGSSVAEIWWTDKALTPRLWFRNFQSV